MKPSSQKNERLPQDVRQIGQASKTSRDDPPAQLGIFKQLLKFLNVIKS
jgi:hypothetical protein